MGARLRNWLSLTSRTGPASDWEGVYARFADIPGATAGFDDDAWLEATRRSTEQALAECERNAKAAVSGDHQLLPLVAAAVRSARVLRVLDFGGGLGISFVYLAASLGKAAPIEYHIIERPRLCEEGARLHAGDARVHFHAAVPQDLPGPDIVYSNSALQYVEDYAGVLTALCALVPRFVLLARCAAGDTPTFASVQVTLPGKRIPYWFLNADELVALLGRLGYALAFAGRAATPLKQDSLPAAYRQGWTRNLLFARSAAR